MLGIDDLLADKRDAILQIAAQYGASNVRVFGSVARGEATLDSDVDFLVDFKPDYRLFDLIGLKQDLEALLDRKVDVIHAANLRDEIRDDVAQDLVSLENTQIIPRTRTKPFVRDLKIYFLDILEHITRIEAITVGGKTEFMDSQLIQDAGARNFELIGDAAKRLPADLTSKHPNINWLNVTSFWDVLVKQYQEIDPDRLWENRAVHMPLLKAAVEAILKDMETPTDN